MPYYCGEERLNGVYCGRWFGCRCERYRLPSEEDDRADQMLHVSMHGAGKASNASSRPKTSIAANVAVAQSCAPMCAFYAKVLGEGVLTRAMLSEYA